MSVGVGRVSMAGYGVGTKAVAEEATGTDIPHTGHHGHYDHARRRRPALLAILCALLLFGGGAAPAVANPSPVSSAEDAPAQAPAPQGDAPTQAAALAALLHSNPVHVTDQLPREIPRSTAPQFKKLAQRTKVPTYVLVLPEQGSSGDRLLGAVHDRLGRDGLYVLVDDMGVADAAAFGVRAPADDASTVALYELPYDAGPLLSFERFTDVIAQGSKKAAERAEAARKKYGGDTGEEVDKMHIDPVDRDNQSFVTGIALSGVPLLILALSPYLRRWRRRQRVAMAAEGSAREQSGAVRRHFTPLRIEAGVALLAAGAIALSASLVFHQDTAGASPPPTASDLSSRVERVAAGLKQDGPLYSDPESPNPLDSEQRDQLTERIGEFNRGPVHIALVPQLTEDESGGEPELFVEAVRQRMQELGAKGDHGVYVVADPLGGSIDVVTYDVRIDANLVAFDLPDSIRYGDDDDRSTDHQLGERLDDLMTFLGKAPRTDRPETSSLGMDDAPEPVEEDALSPLFSGDFWPGLLVGAFAAALLFGVVAALLGLLRLVVPGLRRPPRTVVTSTGGLLFTAPPDPSLGYLRRVARDGIDALGREFDPNAALRSSIRTRVWDCLDAATLLADRDPDGHVDDDATPADLAAAIVLARAGRGALTGADKPCCALNPLHGPATGWRDAQYAAEDQRLRTIPVCAECRVLVDVQPRLAYTLRLTLPGVGRSERVPYEDAPGPLPAIVNGVPQLIRQVREYAGVQ
ncbi:hypothetical protein [Streptomyces sp. BA2]|uniref:hypothetical protein n=1 Tax=Streptomyces sp. BA2 TaxID=436595 RepID=UPI00132751E0|nr:hypothetical protein [Streptomyces sp. BA2]MWA12841.1 hypothetical protein [Streptomyces sp. BA2]